MTSGPLGSMLSWFPHGLENLEKWENFPVREKSGNFEQTGKVREVYPKYWKMREFYSKYWKNEDILASFYFYLFQDFLIEVYVK